MAPHCSSWSRWARSAHGPVAHPSAWARCASVSGARSRWLSRPASARCFTFSYRRPPDSGPFDNPHDEDQDYRPDRRGDDGRDQTARQMKAEHAGKPSAQDRADDPDNDVADQAEAAAPEQGARKPARDGADNQPDNNPLRVHVIPPLIGKCFCSMAAATVMGQGWPGAVCGSTPLVGCGAAKADDGTVICLRRQIIRAVMFAAFALGFS